MTQIIEVVDIGNLANDGTGDPLRVAFDKINNNFARIPTLNQGGPNLAIQYNNGGLSGGNANLTYDVANNQVNTDADISPITSNVVNLGSDTHRFANLWLAKQQSLHVGNVTISENLGILSFTKQANTLQQASLQVDNIYATGDLIAIGNITSTGNVQLQGGINLANIAINSNAFITTDNTANQVIYELPVTQMTTVRLQVTSESTVTQDAQTATIMVNKRPDGIRAGYNVFGTVFQGNVLTRYNVDVAFGNVRLMVSPIPNFEMRHIVSYFVDVN